MEGPAAAAASEFRRTSWRANWNLPLLPALFLPAADFGHYAQVTFLCLMLCYDCLHIRSPRKCQFQKKNIVAPSFSICCYCLGRWEAIWDTAVVEAVLPFEFLQRLADMFNGFTIFFLSNLIDSKSLPDTIYLFVSYMWSVLWLVLE